MVKESVELPRQSAPRIVEGGEGEASESNPVLIPPHLDTQRERDPSRASGTTSTSASTSSESLPAGTSGRRERDRVQSAGMNRRRKVHTNKKGKGKAKAKGKGRRPSYELAMISSVIGGATLFSAIQLVNKLRGKRGEGERERERDGDKEKKKELEEATPPVSQVAETEDVVGRLEEEEEEETKAEVSGPVGGIATHLDGPQAFAVQEARDRRTSHAPASLLLKGSTW